FPVELPEQLIRLYTYRDDLVLDPFMGSGSTLVAAARLGRRYIGYDLEPDYIATARRRVSEALASPPPAGTGSELRQRAMANGPAGEKLAAQAVIDAGFTVTHRKRRLPRSGLTVSLVAQDAYGSRWSYDVAGAFVSYRDGLPRTHVVWRALGRVHALRGSSAGVPHVLLTTDLPRSGSEGDTALRAAAPDAVFDVVVVVAV